MFIAIRCSTFFHWKGIFISYSFALNCCIRSNPKQNFTYFFQEDCQFYSGSSLLKGTTMSSQSRTETYFCTVELVQVPKHLVQMF